ncbi:type VI secretion system baseplate subunit TssK [Pseudomonas sp. HR96]|uniref:type VI secretion system baseplate subunit TssK n=1 Tax=Pseudomonas sp. HR96 TaxID=1027966 RepID=UPI002A75EDFB|nr:type VI secretion system baseplate subunit TssK [Pseudomonas sp. HR96]WPO98790.1 type VI secretion system baseplate subunit TssK [Pseudomonas sp. HR96]
MSSRNPVLWKEGLFVKPQHFQQLEHAAQASVQQKISSLSDVFYGFSELRLNEEHLGFGKISIIRARGIMPDGTVFDIPGDMPAPPPLQISSETANQLVYLCLPLRSADTLAVRWPDSEANCRYLAQSSAIKDTHTPGGDTETLDLAVPNLQLRVGHENLSAFTVLAVGRVLGNGSDSNMLLDERFYPTCVAVAAIPPLQRFLDEVTGMLRERARNIAARVCSPGQSGVADVNDFNLLQVMNRLHPLFQHLARRRSTHPEQLYIALSQACGELLTFTDDQRLPAEYPAYQHDNLSASFDVLETTLRQALGTVLQPRAIPLTIQEQPYGVRTAMLDDLRLLDGAQFILAVRARMPGEQLRQRFAHQAKVYSIENISERISRQLPGITLVPLPVAPRNLPFHAGFTYFELDRQDPAWDTMKGSSGFAFHVGSNFPDLELEFWAIREDVK